jgi:hypothetical protein
LNRILDQLNSLKTPSDNKKEERKHDLFEQDFRSVEQFENI